jgi:hypothetical protein
MHLELGQYEQSSFNILPSIESASSDMRARDQLTLAFSSLGPIFAKHSMCESWGNYPYKMSNITKTADYSQHFLDPYRLKSYFHLLSLL